MSKVIPFPKLRLTTESRWPYEPLVKPRSEDMRVVVEAELNACREVDPIVRLSCAFESATQAFQRATRAMNAFRLVMR